MRARSHTYHNFAALKSCLSQLCRHSYHNFTVSESLRLQLMGSFVDSLTDVSAVAMHGVLDHNGCKTIWASFSEVA